MDLYAELEVARDATRKDIRRAYIRLAKYHHPDKGGEADKFARLALAYKTLYDDEQRKKYDDTGEIPAPVKERYAEIVKVIAKTFTQVLDQGIIKQVNLDTIELMKNIIQTNLDDVSKKLDDMTSAIAEYRNLQEDITFEGEGTNIFAAVLDSKIRMTEDTIVDARKFKDIMEGVMEELKKYKAVSDLVKNIRQFQQTVNSSSTNASYTTKVWKFI